MTQQIAIDIEKTGDAAADGPTARSRSRRRTGIRVVRTSVRGGPVTLAATDTLTIRHSILVDALVELVGSPPGVAASIGPRLQHLMGIGLRRHVGPAPGRGRGHRNGLADALEASLAFTLQRAFVPPTAILALILENRDLIDARWAAAARGERAGLTVSIDALSKTGRVGKRTGRFSEDASGTLTLVDGRANSRNPRSAEAPTITVDLAELYQVMIGNLMRAGVPEPDLRRAGQALTIGSR